MEMLKVEREDNYDRKPPKRENNKRKGVRFEESTTYEHVIVEKISTTSTAAFLHEQGIEWGSLAEAFNCQDEEERDENAVMTELLDLCSWWADHEHIFKGDVHSGENDEDDEDWLSPLNNCLTGISANVSSSLQNWTNSSTDSVPFASELTHNSHEPALNSKPNDKEELENAFQGIMTDDNEVNQDEIDDPPASDIDFWADVEF
uniref:Ovule protein n=1 Tax=Heterorhabditis bacteriophora TaxID=37862 RepID=A0A1I7XNK8_HETBA